MADAPIDVLIIGAGPAGCAAGIVAARAGARVLVLDRAEFPRPKTCGDAISHRGAQLIDALGQVQHAVTTIPHAIVHAAAAVLPDGTRLGRSFGHEPGYIIPRLDLDDLLRGYLEGSGAALRQGVKVRRLLVEGGRIVGAASEDREWRAPVTIAADGPGSLAWAALGLPYERGRALAVASTAYYEGVDFGGATPEAEHYFDVDLPCGYGWIFPPVAGLANVGVYQRVDHFERGGLKLGAMLERFVAGHPERFASARMRGKARIWSLPLAVHPRPPAGPGVLACGDAGRFIDPLSGEGIWQALHTGRLAAQHAVQALSLSGGGGGGGGGDEGGLDARAVRAYQRECERSITWPSMIRLGVQEAMRVLVSTGGYRLPLIKRALARGYGNDPTNQRRS